MGPLKFVPILKRIRWGGRRLGDLLGKAIGPESDYAESWEVCDHRVDQSVVASGPMQGWDLHSLVSEHPGELLGRHAGIRQFPLLIKFLDAHDRLSVQVHPDDEQAGQHLPDERGKTEAWVILAAEPQSVVYAGLKAGIDECALREGLARGTVENCLHRVEVTAGDCLFIPAGTVHAIGEGILLAEVQQSSDVTFRLFDWNRIGADGKARPLHVDQSLACINWASGPVQKVLPIGDPAGDHPVETLVKCPYFTIRRHKIVQPLTIANDARCHIMICLGGSTKCRGEGSEESLALGETVLVPASALPLELIPQSPSTLLEVYWE